MVAYLIPTFKVVSLTFAVAATVTGLQAIVSPDSFSRSFGIPIQPPISTPPSKKHSSPSTPTTSPATASTTTTTYVSLMGIRQLATGVTILTFAYQDQWRAIATILSIIGVLVAGTDGVYLYRAGARDRAAVHAVPGAAIAAVAVAALGSGGI